MEVKESLVRDYPYFECTCLTRSRPLAWSLRDLYSDGAEYIPLAVSQTARVFVTTSIFQVGSGMPVHSV
jgi:hypothetical protein